ncbi:30S ribosomal protein S17 [Candidatus Microgenomates bacterium]|nr:30S ribosomal protein S17 [Candidatus Microgenomates bacterium]
MTKTLTGLVVSTKMTKTAVVAVSEYKRHPLLGKRFKVTSKYQVHDPQAQLHEGDQVIISETRPLSKHKRWQIQTILVKAQEAA